MRVRTASVLVGALVTACSSVGEPPSASPPPIEDYPDAITRELNRRASAIRPVEPSAVPPRHLDAETFPTALVERHLIVSGGPPVDGIPAIDEPLHEPVAAVDWLEQDEPVLALVHNGVARAYPVQIMIWHEIVNDVVAGDPVAVTYCPLCNSGLAFDRGLDGDVLDFGTAGALYQSNLVMYDRQSESLWTQLDGRAVIGVRVGSTLTQVPISTVAWSDFRLAHPDGDVLARPVVDSRPYGRNPYNTYDQRSEPIPGFFTGEVDGRLAPYERVVGIDVSGDVLAIRLADLDDLGVIEFELGGLPLVAWHHPGLASSLNDPVLADGAEVGATGVFDARLNGDELHFEVLDGRIVDLATGSTWDVLGEATAGPLAGQRLESVSHVDTFWFSWATFHVEPRLLRP
jgi:hypothetical protein